MVLTSYLLTNNLVPGYAGESINNSTLSVIKRRLVGQAGFRGGEHYLHFGSELHRSVLEPHTAREFFFDQEDEHRLDMMRAGLHNHKAFTTVLKGSKRENLVKGQIMGVPVHGTLDIWKPKTRQGADIKTTSTRSKAEFIYSALKYDYLRQAWIYSQIAGLDSFVFYGIQKKYPYEVFEFDVAKYKSDYKQAQKEAEFLLGFYKKYGVPVAA